MLIIGSGSFALRRGIVAAIVILGLVVGCPALTIVDTDQTKSFTLDGERMSYRFHVDPYSGDLISDHFGGRIDGDSIVADVGPIQGWVDLLGRRPRELPDSGRGDFRTPSFLIRHPQGYTVSNFRYKGHETFQGKPPIKTMPSTFSADNSDVESLIIHMYDDISNIAIDMLYSVFPRYDAIVRSVNIVNNSTSDVIVEKLASISVDMPEADYDMLELKGDWAREGMRVRRKVEYGIQGFGSTSGYSSHMHNPFVALVDSKTTESHGEAWGFSLVYSGSFSAEVEKGSQGLTRVSMGLNPSQLSWPISPGMMLESPEVVAVFSDSGIGSMSRKFHRLYRRHLMKSNFARQTRPVLLNSWEALHFDFDADKLYDLAKSGAHVGVKLFVLDDGWFGKTFPRVNDKAGLGDWEANPSRFPQGFNAFINNITSLTCGDWIGGGHLRFGLWFEPEMVNVDSELYEKHPDWVLHAGSYPRTETRHQLVLNLALPEVQDYIITAVSKVLSSQSRIEYVKWDSNRGIHEMPSPSTAHAYMVGLYYVMRTLTERFPKIIWEGCASGGGRFDPGILQYFPQIWTSDNTDPVDRLHIQFGTSLAYAPSTMGAHVSASPNGLTGRTTPIEFRAHVAMMGGSFGFELDLREMPNQDRAKLPDLISLAERINAIVVKSDLWRLRLPSESNWPAALYVAEDGRQAVLFYFQLRAAVNKALPMLRLQGLEPKARYVVDGNQTVSGATLMNKGVSYRLAGDYGSKVVFLQRE
ncbi:hypothetical protein L249_0191 [Ophiocordyceps polyrhachis-furcata BCC 54312]|uniref:Alpha-galactosidase n=1 Tax=Ophiocordyceps polyrhachis-furcata BCC 54312 TaxID=1330021 RepID=A0A367LF69_9HYPO|nr:hypothetical protein L249_0191 [Ophiocordyceps polyrhachis-furcata BCC 54312]